MKWNTSTEKLNLHSIKKLTTVLFSSLNLHHNSFILALLNKCKLSVRVTWFILSFLEYILKCHFQKLFLWKIKTNVNKTRPVYEIHFFQNSLSIEPKFLVSSSVFPSNSPFYWLPCGLTRLYSYLSLTKLLLSPFLSSTTIKTFTDPTSSKSKFQQQILFKVLKINKNLFFSIGTRFFFTLFLN